MEVPVGKVLNYYAQIGVASVLLSGTLMVGERVRFAGHTTDFEQAVVSMEIGHQQVGSASAGEVVGIKTGEYARRHDLVCRIKA